MTWTKKAFWLALWALCAVIEFVAQKAKGAVEERLYPPKKDDEDEEPGEPGDPGDERRSRRRK